MKNNTCKKAIFFRRINVKYERMQEEWRNSI
nr:MAG TPA: hypothetical protein [Caudoviricetes sp.]